MIFAVWLRPLTYKTSSLGDIRQVASWSTAAIAHTWLGEEGLFSDLKTIDVPTLILHGIDDQVCLYPLAIAQKNSIKDSKLVSFDACGHFLFYDQREKFNNELIQFIEEVN